MKVTSIHDEQYILSATEALVVKEYVTAVCVNVSNPD